MELSLAREVHRKIPQDRTHLKFENGSRRTRSRFHKSFVFFMKMTETLEETSYQMVRLDFRHFAAATTRVLPDFALLKHISRVFRELTHMRLLKAHGRSPSVAGAHVRV